MIDSILRDVWREQGEGSFRTSVHIYTRSGRGYHNVRLTTPPTPRGGKSHGIIFREEGDRSRRIVLNLDVIETIELVDG